MDVCLTLPRPADDTPSPFCRLKRHSRRRRRRSRRSRKLARARGGGESSCSLDGNLNCPFAALYSSRVSPLAKRDVLPFVVRRSLLVVAKVYHMMCLEYGSQFPVSGTNRRSCPNTYLDGSGKREEHFFLLPLSFRSRFHFALRENSSRVGGRPFAVVTPSGEGREGGGAAVGRAKGGRER